MKLTVNNKNYSAAIVKIETIIQLEGCDNVVGVPFFGYQAIVSKDVNIGDIGIVFTAETQLSEQYCFENNLYRDPELNKDKSKKGYMETNRRIRAMKFRGHKSSALFMPLESLNYIKGNEGNKRNIGDAFDTINDIEICKKYEIIRDTTPGRNKLKGKTKTFIRIDNKTFPEHIDTENYKRNKHLLNDYDIVYVSQKLHGTSGRFGYVEVRKKLSLLEKIAEFLGVKVSETEYDYIAGSRKVIKDSKVNNDTTGYYKSDLWNKILDRYKNIIPKNWILYGEIIGRDGEKPIQKNYTYNLEKGEMELYVYRIIVINEDGISVDLGFEQIIEFCINSGLKNVPYLEHCFHIHFKPEKYENTNYHIFISDRAIQLCKESPCDEGVVIRRDGLQPYVLKNKSPDFLEHETKLLDKGEIDTESNESLQS